MRVCAHVHYCMCVNGCVRVRMHVCLLVCVYFLCVFMRMCEHTVPLRDLLRWALPVSPLGKRQCMPEHLPLRLAATIAKRLGLSLSFSSAAAAPDEALHTVAVGVPRREPCVRLSSF